MAQHDDAGRVRRSAGNPACQYLADSTQAHMPESIMMIINGNHLAILSPRTLAYDHNCIAWYVGQPSVQSGFAYPFRQKIENSLVSKRMFGYENDVRLTGDPGP